MTQNRNDVAIPSTAAVATDLTAFWQALLSSAAHLLLMMLHQARSKHHTKYSF
jgi:hypothetical protein